MPDFSIIAFETNEILRTMYSTSGGYNYMNTDIPTSSAQVLLTLLHFKGIGRISAMRLIQRFDTLEAMFSAGPSAIKKCIPSRSYADFIKPEQRQAAWDRATDILETAERLGVRILTYQQPEYPPLLQQIEKFPLLLYVRGTLRRESRNIACVGTRKPSEFGKIVTRRLVRLFVEHHWGIVGSLESGIATIAHQTALEAGGTAIAVLAHGLDTVYPSHNAGLADAIVEAGGCLVTDQPFDTKPLPPQHMQRDRIQSGLSVATVPLQTAANGATMQAVLFALLQQRRLYAPMPPEKYAPEKQNQGLLALLNRTGPQLAELFAKEKKLPALLKRDFADCSVARPIRGRNDYAQLLNELDELHHDSIAEGLSHIK